MADQPTYELEISDLYRELDTPLARAEGLAKRIRADYSCMTAIEVEIEDLVAGLKEARKQLWERIGIERKRALRSPTVVPRSVAMWPTDANGSAVEETP